LQTLVARFCAAIFRSGAVHRPVPARASGVWVYYQARLQTLAALGALIGGPR
jgi:hypothetical protein